MYGLIFDCDGVLGDTEGPVCEASIRAFQEMYGVEMKQADFAPFIGTGSVRYAEGPAAAYGLRIDTEAVLDRVHGYFEEIITSGRDISFPGVNDLIAAVHAEPDWKLAIATSSPKCKSQQTLVAAGIDMSKFAVYVNGDMVTHKKPDPEIYLTTAGKLGLDPGRCVVIEDAINGVEAAKAAGMRVIGVTTSFGAAQLAQADHVVASLEAVNLALLHSLLNGHGKH
ncbi:MAG: HAD family phosphatase [Candidatus Hydrogenedentes bacterium]|nr:HAD family phosphatase [Candidatus Hydrogenedentota bacterium]